MKRRFELEIEWRPSRDRAITTQAWRMLLDHQSAPFLMIVALLNQAIP